MHESMFFLSLRRWKAEFILNRHRLNMKEKTNSYTFSRKFRCRMWEKWPKWRKRSNLSEIWFCYLVKYGKNEIACFQNKGIQRFRVCL